jgi:PadR family transcriptional regulator PadR
MPSPRLSHQGLKVLKLFLDDPGSTLSGADVMRSAGLLSGTAYPLLIRFEEAGLLSSKWESEKPDALGRPRRRLYSITGAGLAAARQALEELGVPVLRPAFAGAIQ